MIKNINLALLLSAAVLSTSVWAADMEFKLPGDSSGALTIDGADGAEAFSVQADGTTKVMSQAGGVVISGTDGSLVQPKSINDDSLVLHIQGGDKVYYGTDNGSEAAGFLNNSWRNLILNEKEDLLDGYDPLTGIYTVAESGLYHIRYYQGITFTPDPADVFDGKRGVIKTTIEVNGVTVAYDQHFIFKGSSGSTELATLNATVHLNQGDVVNARLTTFNSERIGTNLETNLSLSMGGTFMRIYKY